MTTEIISELKSLEREHRIKILYAVESGSRAWGFASSDSDWDVRYIYIHEPEWYLSIDEGKDSSEKILPNDLDLSGWEIRKALKLFRKSNPPLLEWLRSPILYLKQFSFANELNNLAAEYFDAKSCLHHYLHMAEGNFRNYLQRETVRVKKYFYVLRPVLACSWIEQTNTMAPMEFRKLLDSQVSDPSVKYEIQKLLQRKIAGEELNEEPRIDILNEYLSDKINYFNDVVKSFPAREQPKTDKLNLLFRKMIREVWQQEST